MVLTLFALNNNLSRGAGADGAAGRRFYAPIYAHQHAPADACRQRIRGRVLSLYTLTFFGFTPFGNLAVGAVSEWIGMSVAITVSSRVLTLVSAVVIFWRIPDLKRLP